MADLRVTRQAVEVMAEDPSAERALRVTRQAVEVAAEDPSAERALRVTRQAVEVVAQDPSAERRLRVTRQTVEVMASDPPPGDVFADASNSLGISQMASCVLYVPPKLASNSLSLADNATTSIVADRSASSDLLLSGAADARVVFSVQATSTLSLYGQADGTLARVAHADLTFSQQATVAAVRQVSAGSILALSDSATGLAIPTIEVSAGSILELSDQAEGYNATTHVASQSTLTLDAGSHGNKVAPVAATTPIYFTEVTLDRVTFEEIEVEHGIFDSVDAYIYADPAPTANILSFAQRAGVVRVRADGISVSAANVLTLSQSGNRTPTGNAISQLTLGHSATADVGKPAGSVLTLGQQASQTIERFVSASSVLSLRQVVNTVLAEGCVTRLYTPFVGSTDDPDAPAPPLTDVPTLERVAGIQLYWPIDAPTMTVTLRGPELDNKDRLRFQRINRETRGGTLVVFADTIWPKVQQLTLEFTGLEENEAQSLLSFIAATLGKEIGLRDWENRHWAGVITSPDEPIIRNGRHNISTALEFEGVPV